MRLLLAISIIGLLATPAIAQDAKSGWVVRYSQDAFSGTIFSEAVAAQETDRTAFGLPSITVICGTSGDLLATFYDGSMFVQNTLSVDFRTADGAVKNYAFDRRPDLYGTNLAAADPASSLAILALFSDAGQSVPFRSGDKQGLLPSIGASFAFDAVRATCPE